MRVSSLNGFQIRLDRACVKSRQIKETVKLLFEHVWLSRSPALSSRFASSVVT